MGCGPVLIGVLGFGVVDAMAVAAPRDLVLHVHLTELINEDPDSPSFSSPEPSFWEEHPRVTIAAVSAGLLQAGVIAGLLLQRGRRRKVEGKLRLSEERYREVVESQSEMVCRFRPDTTLTFVNEAYCRFFGREREELLGQSFLPLVPSETHHAIRELVQFLVTRRQRKLTEHEVLLPDGSVGWLEWHDFPILDEHGDVEELQGIGRDVTERHLAVEARMEAERQLAQATRLALLGELAASIAHEINQPLGAILSNAEAAEFLLKSGSYDELHAILADIRKDDLRASEVVQHVRNLVSKREVLSEPLQLNTKVQNVLRLIGSDAHRRGVTVLTDLDHSLPEIRGDRIQLEQVLINLVLNGMDAMHDTPPVERRLVIATRNEHGHTVVVSVTDAGHGIPTEKMPLIFQSFFSTKEDGMGLGLALARSIAELHRGGITAENNPEGGATFRLRLPVNGVHLSIGRQ